MKGHPITWYPDELAWIEVRKDMPRRELHRMFVARFDRDDISLGAFKALCKRKGWMTGRTGCFEKGQTPPNKGRKGFCPPGCEKGWFRKGSVPPNRRRLGAERIGKDGYIEISVPVVNPYTGHSRRFMHKHRYLWEQINGPLPKGMCLKCVDGDRTNTDPSNWIAIPRALLPRLAGRWNMPYDTAPEELKPTLLATARLQHKAKEARKQ